MNENFRERPEDVAKRWIVAVTQGLAKHTDAGQQTRILELCGQSCAKHDLQELRRLKKQAKDQHDLLKVMNEHIPWCGTWIREKEYIHSVCSSCGCPLVKSLKVEPSPVFCVCSRGWIKAIFSEAFDKDVDVRLSTSIGRGDKCCEFFVYL